MAEKPTNPRRAAKQNAVIRTLVQLVFFLAMPGVFVAGFNGVKAIFQSVGTGQPLSWTGFTMALAVLCLFTMLFGRFFCGWVCSFGALGDFVYWLSDLVQKKLLRRKKQFRLPERWLPWGQKLKYLILATVVVLCALNLYGTLGVWSPWEAFSMLTALRLPPSGSTPRASPPQDGRGCGPARHPSP